MAVPKHKPANQPADGIRIPDEFPILTQIAFYLLLALVAARAMLQEYIRDPLLSTDLPRGANASVMVWLNLLCCVPALLVLARRAIDKHYVLRLDWSHALLALLAIWTGASVMWASDKWVALIGASTWIATLVVLWTFVQLVRSWHRLRVVAGVLVGLLLVLAVHGLIYRYVDAPEMAEYWRTQGPQILAERGWPPESFQAKQFERKMLAAEVMGFARSPNSYAAIVVTLGFVALGVLLQRVRDREDSGWIGAAALLVLPAIVMPFYTGSKTALATAIVGGMLLVATIVVLPKWSARFRSVFFAGVGAVGVGAIVLIAFGLIRGGLPGASLDFRWNYWTGAAGMIAERPMLGTGWENFGDAYLAHRLPRAAEEIKDPHNFVVRFFTELGIIGGVIALLWLGRLAWEVTRPVTVAATAGAGRSELAWIGWMCAGAMVIGALSALDFAQSPDVWTFDLLKRVLYGLLLASGALVVMLRMSGGMRAEDRPAPLLASAMTVAIGVLLLHSMVDFAMFEVSGGLVLATLAGSLAGLRMSSAAGRRRTRVLPWIGVGVAVVAWVLSALMIAWPITSAENAAHRGDQSATGGLLPEASHLYEQASADAPVENAAYFDRLVGTLAALNEEPTRVRAVLARRIAADPRSPVSYLGRARYERSLPLETRRTDQITADYHEAVRLNPHEMSIREEFASFLIEVDDLGGAVEQLTAKLAINDQLDATEPERLTPEQVESTRSRITALQALPNQPAD